MQANASLHSIPNYNFHISWVLIQLINNRAIRVDVAGERKPRPDRQNNTYYEKRGGGGYGNRQQREGGDRYHKDDRHHKDGDE